MLKILSKHLCTAGLVAAMTLAPLQAPNAQEDAAASEYIFSEDEDLFLLGNTVDILFHEGGHLVIDLFEIPILGQEEDAADNFATLSLLSIDDEFASFAISQAIFGDYLRSAIDGVPDMSATAYFGRHDLDIQRASRKLCYLASARPETYGELAREFNLGEELTADCNDRLAATLQRWVRTLEDFEAYGETQHEVAVIYEDATPRLEPYRQLIESNEALEYFGGHLGSELALPRDITIRAKVCNDANAYYLVGEGEIVFCYDFLADYHDYYKVAQKLAEAQG